MGAWSYRRVEPVKFRAFLVHNRKLRTRYYSKITGRCTTRTLPLPAVPLKRQQNTTYSREDKIRMELYRIILSLYNEGYRTFTCNPHSYIGLLGADTIVMLREAGKCPEIILSVAIPETVFRQIPTRCIMPCMTT